LDLGLDGRVALVAGGSSGLGLAIAKEFAAEGAHVAIGARGPERLERARAEIEAVARGRVEAVSAGRVEAVSRGRIGAVSRGRIAATSVDITDTAAARAWVDSVAADFGALHVVVATSGGSPPFGPAGRFGAEDVRSAVDAALIPPVNLAYAALPHLRAAGWGRILFIASETAVVPIAPLTLSGVTRAGLVRFAQGLTADAGRDGITVNVIAPSLTRTPPMERLAASLAGPGAAAADVEAQFAAMGRHNAFGRVADPAEVAAVAAFLASARASFVTGGVHLIDGGASAIGPEQPHLPGSGRATDQ
jgi:3-oxoacyl-[acyl-carrier protein] reductase